MGKSEKIMLLSPSPVSLLCAILLCLPLAIFFTIVTPPTATTNVGVKDIPRIPIATSSSTSVNPVAADVRVPATVTTTEIKTPNPVAAASKRTIKQEETIDNATGTPPPRRRRPSSKKGDDESLFRRAARVNPNPTGHPRKLAYMFLTASPLHLAPLWELYFNRIPKGLYNIYIHADPRFTYDPPFSGVFENRVINSSKPTRRHSPTLISAARRLLSHALLHDPSNSMFALLSPSCIPLHSFNFTYRTLVPSGKSFIEILKNETGAYHRWAVRGAEAMLPVLPFEDFRIGSQFFVLTRKHARAVVSDRRLWSKFRLPCLRKHTCFPEEHYFPTLLNMKDPRGCVPATLTHVDWRDRHDGHPRTYKPPEVGPDLILAFRRERPRYGDDTVINGSDSSYLRKGHHPFLFARKFPPESIENLTRIASDVIFKD